MKSIHLIEKNSVYVCVDSNTNEWETGNWVVSVKSAAELIDGNIYLHKTQKNASYMGGIITGIRVIKQNDKDKIVFRFKCTDAHVGCITTPDGWRNEQKRVSA